MDKASHSPIIALERIAWTCYLEFSMIRLYISCIFLIAGRATAKEIDIARAYFDKDSGADVNIGSYWNVGIGMLN